MTFLIFLVALAVVIAFNVSIFKETQKLKKQQKEKNFKINSSVNFTLITREKWWVKALMFIHIACISAFIIYAFFADDPGLVIGMLVMYFILAKLIRAFIERTIAMEFWATKWWIGLLLNSVSWLVLIIVVIDPLTVDPIILNEPTFLATWLDSLESPFLKTNLPIFLGVLFAIGASISLLWFSFVAHPVLFSSYQTIKSKNGIKVVRKMSGKVIWQLDQNKKYSYRLLVRRIYRRLRHGGTIYVAVHTFEQNGKAAGFQVGIGTPNLKKVPEYRTYFHKKKFEVLHMIEVADAEEISKWIKAAR